MGHAPAFAGIGELAEDAEGGAVEDEARVRLPGPLEEVRAPVDDALAEVLGGNDVLLEDASGGGVELQDGGVAGQAGAFVEVTVAKEEAFGVAGGRVREGGDDLVAVDGGLGVKGQGEQQAEENAESHSCKGNG